MGRIDVDKRIFIRAKPETVFSYFTDAEKMCRWLGRRVTLHPAALGKFGST